MDNTINRFAILAAAQPSLHDLLHNSKGDVFKILQQKINSFSPQQFSKLHSAVECGISNQNFLALVNQIEDINIKEFE